jgi:glycosyltransferase involved in cell wall biosynthesis
MTVTRKLAPAVTHVTPALFGPNGMFGGGERYPLELAKAMSKLTPTRLISFADEPRTFALDQLQVQLYKARHHAWHGELNPVSLGYLADLFARSGVLHAHQYECLPTNLALVAGRLRHRLVFCTDHGGRSRHAGNKLHLDTLLAQFLPVSEFSRATLPQLTGPHQVIYGGVDPARFHPDDTERTHKVVFVGRLLPHKGIDVLIKAMPADVLLEVYGRSSDPRYLHGLHLLAAAKRVTFHHEASDDDIVAAYRSARIVVLPSVLQTTYGQAAPRSELLGLTLLESMACATPVICTSVGGMPEIVRDGETGLVVAPGDVEQLRAAIGSLLGQPKRWSAMSADAAEWVRSGFTWRHIAERCLAQYDHFRSGSPPSKVVGAGATSASR